MKILVLCVVLYGIVLHVIGNPLDTTPGCNYHYFQHYFAKGCTPVYHDRDNKCPVRFSCPCDISDDPSGCRFQGHIIPVGHKIPTGNPCQKCSCYRESNNQFPQIGCVMMTCSFDYIPPHEGPCYEVFAPHTCCPLDKVCGPEWLLLVTARSTCELKGESYNLFQKFKSVENPCLVCTCTDRWTGIPETDPSCKRLYCEPEGDGSGCIPIYDEAHCCPTEYECGQNVQNTTLPLTTFEDIVPGFTCVFQGSHYGVGQSLHVTHPSKCIKCDCVTPPEFTCVFKTCE